MNAFFFYILPLIFSSPSPPGESGLRGEPDRCGGGDVGHHHVGGSPLQPVWVPSLGRGQERHRELITAAGVEDESLKDGKRWGGVSVKKDNKKMTSRGRSCSEFSPFLDKSNWTWRRMERRRRRKRERKNMTCCLDVIFRVIFFGLQEGVTRNAECLC